MAEKAAKAAKGEPAKNRGTGKIKVSVDGVIVELSPRLEAAVQRAYKRQSPPLPKEMTTSQAATFLDVSRPFVIKLVSQGELPCRMVGKHRRIPTEALHKHRERMFRRATKAADEMARAAQEMGLYAEHSRAKKP